MAHLRKRIKDKIDAVERALERRPKARKATGYTLIVVGTIALLTPVTPGSWLILVGLWVLGFRFGSWWNRMKTARFTGPIARPAERAFLRLIRSASVAWSWLRGSTGRALRAVRRRIRVS